MRNTCGFCDGPLPCLTHREFPKGQPMDRKELMRLLRALSESHYQSIQQTCMSQAADEIERLRGALRDVMIASNDPYEVARTALGPGVLHS